MCSWWWAELPPETCRAVYRNIKKLYIVASCWTIIDSRQEIAFVTFALTIYNSTIEISFFFFCFIRYLQNDQLRRRSHRTYCVQSGSFMLLYFPVVLNYKWLSSIRCLLLNQVNSMLRTTQLCPPHNYTPLSRFFSSIYRAHELKYLWKEWHILVLTNVYNFITIPLLGIIFY